MKYLKLLMIDCMKLTEENLWQFKQETEISKLSSSSEARRLAKHISILVDEILSLREQLKNQKHSYGYGDWRDVYG